MRVEDVEFTVLEAIHLVECVDAWSEYLDESGLGYSRELLQKLHARYDEATEADHAAYWQQRHPQRPVWRGWRPDVRALIQFVDAHPNLVRGQMRDAFELCIRRSLSIDVVAERPRIGRETVRTQLRRLRERARKYGASLELEPLVWVVEPEGCQKGWAPRWHPSE